MHYVLEYLQVRYLTEKGQGMAEYALVLAFVVAVIVLISNTNFVQAVNNVFLKVNNGIVNK